VRKRLGIVAVILFAATVALLLWRNPSSREPSYEGRSLTSWLDHHVASSAAVPPYGSPGWKKADEAIRHIGTNAIPTLLEMIGAKDKPKFMIAALEQARRLGLTQSGYRYASPRHEEAEYAFEILGTNAASAVPELIRIYEQDISPSSQRCAALALGHIGRGAQAALPVLIQRFNHTNNEVRFNAVSAVMHIGGPPDVLIPAFSNALRGSDVNVRWNALVGLSSFGSRARSAVPTILPLLSDPAMIGDSPIRQQVETTLWRIAPELVGQPVVVEDATPLIANGVTKEALKVIFQGKRRALIPPGRTVPAIAQYWNSDPRPKLVLYRGAPETDEGDQFLGEFEILDFATTESINISTLCIVANGQIILTARDNNRDVFLPIRRLAPDANQ
jgi:hypothetical protein